MISRAALLLFVFASACNHAFTEETWRIEGIIVDARGMPIPHATVALACPDNQPKAQRATTSDMGRFELYGRDGALVVKRCTLTIIGQAHAPRALPATSACVRTYSEIRDRPCILGDGRITF